MDVSDRALVRRWVCRTVFGMLALLAPAALQAVLLLAPDSYAARHADLVMSAALAAALLAALRLLAGLWRTPPGGA